MNKSPYDNLPSSHSDKHIRYVDVEVSKPNENEEPVKHPVRTIPLNVPPKYSPLKIHDRINTSEYVLPFESTLLVPDTMPDMAEILMAEGKADLSHSTSAFTLHDDVAGNITFYTVYRPETCRDCALEVIKSVIPFKSANCFKGGDASSYHVNIAIRNLEAVKVNERKFVSKGEISLIITEIPSRRLEVLNDFDDQGFICKSETINVTSLCLDKEELTDISQDIDLSPDEHTPVKILMHTSVISENHHQVTSGKLVINGTVTSRILYTGSLDGEISLCSKTIKTDFTQFIPVSDSLDSDLVSISFLDQGLDITISDSNKFLLQGQIKTNILAYCHETVNMISDIYHKSSDLAFDKEETILHNAECTLCGEISSREVINLDSGIHSPDRLLTGSCSLPVISIHQEKCKLIIEGTVHVRILALDENNMPFVIECPVSIRSSFDVPEPAQNGTADVTVSIRDFWFDDINSRQIEVNVNASATIWLCAERKLVTLRSIAMLESDANDNQCSISLCVTDEKDTLWDIAKRCKCDLNDILRLNNIDSSTCLTPGTKLLIMK